MRRILTALVASSLLALALPAAASAHHANRHRRHHHKAHTVVFAPSTKPATTPTTPATETMATVASFENEILKITLPDGSTVSGKVTESTFISCGCSGHEGFGASPESQHDGGQQGWQGGDEDQGGSFAENHGDWEQGSSPQDQGSCGTSALVSGAKVQLAELNVSSAGAVWEKVELYPKP
ncbi:MAG TPA: hypothetical protein VNV44_09920 [Solirubrobacteraceae bacterium]|jgi:hypothetical protein|nr:hypothetical protein [Solirubrobacteraceae bacterium]